MVQKENDTHNLVNENKEELMIGGPGFRARRFNRRKRRDFFICLINLCIVASWIFVVFSFVIFKKALPVGRTFYDRYFKVNVGIEQGWDAARVQALFYLMAATFCVSLLGLYLRSKRHRRMDDHYSASLIVFGIVSAIGMVAYVIYLFGL